MKVKQLTESKNRHWVIKKRDDKLIVQVKYHTQVLMEYQLPEEFYQPLQELDIIKIEQ